MCHIHISTVEFKDLTNKRLFARACLQRCMAQNESGYQNRLTGLSEKEEEKVTERSTLGLEKDLCVFSVFTPIHTTCLKD